MTRFFDFHSRIKPEYIFRSLVLLKRRISRQDLTVIVGSSWKVGSTWLFNLVRDLGYFNSGIKGIPEEYKEFGTILLDKPGILDFLSHLSGYNIFKTHSYPVEYQKDSNIRFLTIYRDPRDVVISAIFYAANIEEYKGGWGKEFRQLSEKDKIMVFFQRSEVYITKMEKWLETPTAYSLKYEDLKESPVKELLSVLDYLGIARSESKIKQVIEKNSFETISGRKPGDEQKDKILRKGIVGDWKNYFDNHQCIEMFKNAQNGRWNRLLVKMGYEDTLDW
ncbi:sulfotransferase domain-containing protein [Thermodesulfobacteriota bacterium]